MLHQHAAHEQFLPAAILAAPELRQLLLQGTARYPVNAVIARDVTTALGWHRVAGAVRNPP